MRRKCSCEIEEYLQTLEQFKNHERKQRTEQVLSYSSAGERFLDKTFEQFLPSAQTGNALRRAKQFVLSVLNASNRVRGIIYIGPVGTGKTHLAASIYNELRNNGRACVFSTVPELLDRIRATYRTESIESEDGILGALKKCDVLFLDDLGAERHKGEDWAAEKLFTIFDARYRNYLPIIGTTNCQPNDLEEKLGARTMSRIREMCELVPCLGDDFRRQQNTSAAGGSRHL